MMNSRRMSDMAAETRHTRIIVWMWRVLRVQDNAPLWNAIRDGREVIPVVCLSDDPRCLVNLPRRDFIRNALCTLDRELRERGSKLFVRVGSPEREIPASAQEYDAKAVYAAQVYDPEALRRDASIASSLRKIGVQWQTFQDRVLFEGGHIISGSGLPYKVYAPYMHAWRERWDDAPRPLPAIRKVVSPKVTATELRAFPWFGTAVHTSGEAAARRRLKRFMKGPIHAYRQNRDLPAIDGTSRLSADLANGTISVRSVYWSAREVREEADRKGRENIDTFINELIWREFYYQILSSFPFVVDCAFKEEFRNIAWDENRKHFDAWRAGRTGYPIVDAAMRQLNSEGWMHNRARMIVASFLTKDLHINWQHGEEYFFGRLVDADIASNNGGWQWAAGTGTDASPYFRIFNPVLQAKKFDPDGVYVRKYVPELSRVPIRMIHEPWRLRAEEQWSARCVVGKDYPARIVDHEEERQFAIRLYRQAATKRLTATVNLSGRS
jgi:deoxyribodipyrimidine photo-lyase